jgi:hypothetical protein
MTLPSTLGNAQRSIEPAIPAVKLRRGSDIGFALAA